MARGNALCALAGIKVSFDTPVGEVDVFIQANENNLLTFRGGWWKEWWAEDLTLLAALAKVYLSEDIKGIIVFHEVDNQLSEKYITAPNKDEASKLVQAAYERWKDHRRISKNTPRAAALCQYCPVKRQCDSMDLEKGETNDWGPDYTVG